MALGANLPSNVGGPLATLSSALAQMPSLGLQVVAVSPWYSTAAWPDPRAPRFVNGVARLTTRLTPSQIMGRLLDLESAFGRCRQERNAPRTIDLDLLAYDDRVCRQESPVGLVLPHPRMHERRFVLLPLCDIAADWIHPGLKVSAKSLLNRLPEDDCARL
ncbi:MAG: 2-amino-4-hydroxy-6-hydroxymethyldihydropteridine diphosphokinase [Geminicoccaceae bacterium]